MWWIVPRWEHVWAIEQLCQPGTDWNLGHGPPRRARVATLGSSRSEGGIAGHSVDPSLEGSDRACDRRSMACVGTLWAQSAACPTSNGHSGSMTLAAASATLWKPTTIGLQSVFRPTKADWAKAIRGHLRARGRHQRDSRTRRAQPLAAAERRAQAHRLDRRPLDNAAFTKLRSAEAAPSMRIRRGWRGRCRPSTRQLHLPIASGPESAQLAQPAREPRGRGRRSTGSRALRDHR